MYINADVAFVLSLVQLEPGVPREGGVAALHVALVRLLPRVGPHVGLQVMSWLVEALLIYQPWCKLYYYSKVEQHLCS